LRWELPTEKTYNKLIEYFGINKMDGLKTYNELKFIMKKYKRVFNLNGNKYISNVLEFKKDYGRLHPTQKPVALMEFLIKTYTNECDLVLDFACGSGSTLIACENLNRKWIGIEISEEYCEITKQRLEVLK
jgi:site-specific DNA-methyltransferase (adenine-specific)